MGCIMEVKYCVVKSRTFEASVSFTTGYEEVVADPSLYECQLVFRDYQDAAAPVYLTLTVDVAAVPPDVPAAATFTATAAQMSQLPDWDIVAYCDLRAKDGSSVVRLYNAEVEVHQ